MADEIGESSAEQGVRRAKDLSFIFWPKEVARKTQSNIPTPEKGRKFVTNVL